MSGEGPGDSADVLARVLAAVEAQGAQLAALTERAGPQRAPAHTLEELHRRWATSRARLASFACDDQRARRLLGLEPFELRDDEGMKRLVFWAPEDGPHASIPLGKRDVSTLSGDDVDAFRSWYYVQTTRRKKEPTPATVNRYVMMLKRILNHNVKRNVIERSPLLGYEEEEEDNARQVVLTEGDLDLLLTAFGDDAMMRALVLLGYDSGMRLAELVCCRWRWFDESAGAVEVPGAIAKNGEMRKTDLSVRALDACKGLPRAIKADYVFPNPETSKPYNKRWIHERFVRAVARAGITGRDGAPPRLHDLRRSFITLMDMRGVPRAVGMEKSGHKSEAVYRRYRIVAPTEFRQAWLTMEAGRQEELAALAAARQDALATNAHSGTNKT